MPVLEDSRPQSKGVVPSNELVALGYDAARGTECAQLRYQCITQTGGVREDDP